MEFRVAGNELHLRGPVRGDEVGLLKDVELAHGKAIDTVVFRDSPGGDSWTAYRIGERIRDKGWRTVVAGPCRSACAVMFLGGTSRHFAHAARPEAMALGFHGPWNANFMDAHAPAIRGRVALRDWIVARTGGKVDAALLERFLGNERQATLLYVFDPAQFKQGAGSSAYFCAGTEPRNSPPWDACEKLAGHDAFSLGFVTSPERVRVRSWQELPAPFKPRAVFLQP